MPQIGSRTISSSRRGERFSDGLDVHESRSGSTERSPEELIALTIYTGFDGKNETLSCGVQGPGESAAGSLGSGAAVYPRHLARVSQCRLFRVPEIPLPHRPVRERAFSTPLVCRSGARSARRIDLLRSCHRPRAMALVAIDPPNPARTTSGRSIPVGPQRGTSARNVHPVDRCERSSRPFHRDPSARVSDVGRGERFRLATRDRLATDPAMRPSTLFLLLYRPNEERSATLVQHGRLRQPRKVPSILSAYASSKEISVNPKRLRPQRPGRTVRFPATTFKDGGGARPSRCRWDSDHESKSKVFSERDPFEDQRWVTRI